MFAYAPYMLFISSFDGERNPLRNVHGRREISLGAETSAELETESEPLMGKVIGRIQLNCITLNSIELNWIAFQIELNCIAN